MSEVTLGGYMAKHARSAAFGGNDGRAYSVGLWIDDAKDERGRYGAALVFVRWDESGAKPDGHVETDYLAWGTTPEEAEERIKALSLFDVKAALDEAIAARPEGEW
ncbi:MAG TPA: hypothetical protein VL295_03170 [Gemmatimonadales bacterium]|nr:hypothetical protein [Gemmatimonadales bacterium]